jgi:hypothetical protein
MRLTVIIITFMSAFISFYAFGKSRIDFSQYSKYCIDNRNQSDPFTIIKDEQNCLVGMAGKSPNLGLINKPVWIVAESINIDASENIPYILEVKYPLDKIEGWIIKDSRITKTFTIGKMIRTNQSKTKNPTTQLEVNDLFNTIIVLKIQSKTSMQIPVIATEQKEWFSNIVDDTLIL